MLGELTDGTSIARAGFAFVLWVGGCARDSALPFATDDAMVARVADAATAGDLAIRPDLADLTILPDLQLACGAGQVRVPGGAFFMGASDLRNVGQGSAPVHRVVLSTYCLDQTEVTVAAYRVCVDAGVCGAPDGKNNSPLCNWPIAGRDDHPVNCVDWTQADAYCRFAGRMLPTEAQWEYAARYSDERDYPWGNTAPANQLCWSGGGGAAAATCPVGSHPAGDTALGIHDMAGNVWEWVADWLDVYQADPVTDPTGPQSSPFQAHADRGGAFNVSDPVAVRAAERDGSLTLRRIYTMGFRCAGLLR